MGKACKKTKLFGCYPEIDNMKITNVIKAFSIFKNPLMFYAMYFNLIKNKKILKTKDGLEFIVRPILNDHITLFENYFYADYFKPLKKITNNNSNLIIIDIGGHIGTFSIPVSYKSKQVYVFEPSKSNYQILTKNIQLNNRQNIKTINAAIDTKTSRKYLYFSTTNAGGNSFYNVRKNNQQKKEIIKTLTLESQLKKYKINKIDLIKIDCEGAEFPILLNLKKSTYQKIHSIIIEYHNHLSTQYNHLDLIKILKLNRFKVKILKKFSPNTGIIFASK